MQRWRRTGRPNRRLSYEGLTVGIGNTDAEDRLILCDALAEASTEKPELQVDMATLTGAARVALDPELAALFCNDEALARALIEAAAADADAAVAPPARWTCLRVAVPLIADAGAHWMTKRPAPLQCNIISHAIL